MEARQLIIDYTLRGEQLRLIDRAVFARSYQANDGKSVSGTAVKAVLRVIDSHAGEKSTCYASTETIASEACCGVRTTLRALFVLRHQLAILIEQDERNPAGRRWRVHRTICWANLAALTEPQPASAVSSPAQIRLALDATWGAPTCHQGRYQVPLGTGSHATRGNLSSYGTEKEPPPPTATVDVVEAAAAELVQLGVEWPAKALDAAFSARPAEHVLELIAFFRQNGPANGWGPGALVQRLTSARYHTAIDRGWPPVSKAVEQELGRKRFALEAEAAKELERTHGPTLDRMLAHDVEQLAREVFRGDAVRWSMFVAGGHRATALVRQPLLQAIADRGER